mmetsp:Transcript_8320/g.17971  ORF Transcript_8320/g.17971 Transcript_8320/m.17971 type:complete len:389 (-) Transcript_8320:355-1521(-)|eukprot:CAMPEP_0172539656 /NCGR_PEP_ID=MMETSP1067-20121228/10822_1 /TAXON_ID=265564 ORGANISM="Thalassiosira punctigera, Strain Tpunct2005C2" /NCGR_SAMPLE_ID=MMETSP1067 /ASSEMBLY_ACC=CAM_ASM_000444 /LENGTH=388 /DNA_ID=CAMNT_0013325381 /DNA_START=20 /DNA_END=1186 /DNA_ORIENTATION=-
MQQLRTNLFTVAICALTSLGFFSLSRPSFSSESSSLSSPSNSNLFGSRSLLLVSDFVDPKSTDPKDVIVPPPADDGDFEEKITWLNDLKTTAPSINEHRPPAANSQVVVDVISIGCDYKFGHMMTQSKTWASSVRNFWGFTEHQDFDTNCASMDEEASKSYVQMCRAPLLGSKYFGRGHDPAKSGWYCAQRRPGRALGWLVAEYQERGTPIPDVLIFSDDDTSVDIEKVKNIILGREEDDVPFVGSGSVLQLGRYHGFRAPHGGFGTFFNKAAVQELTQPIYCDERQDGSDFMKNACEKLRLNVAGELDTFREGDSVLNIFYKHASHPQFCMHSDWQIGYMIENYSRTILEQILPPSRRHWCAEESVTCHNQSPKNMEAFVIAHPQIE